MNFDIETPQLSPSNSPTDEAKVEKCCKNENIIACLSIAFLFASDLTKVPFSLDIYAFQVVLTLQPKEAFLTFQIWTDLDSPKLSWSRKSSTASIFSS